MKNAIIYWFVFLALQVLAGGIIQGVYLLWKGPGAVLDATGTIPDDGAVQCGDDGFVSLAEVGCGGSSLDTDASLGGTHMVCVGCLGNNYPFGMASGTDA